MIIFAEGGPRHIISRERLQELLLLHIKSWQGRCKKVLLVPPDMTRSNSRAGEITQFLYASLKAGGSTVHVMPALGTHVPMNKHELVRMFGSELDRRDVLDHDWRNDITYLGSLPSSRIKELSGGKLDYDINIAVNRHLLEGQYDQIVSIGQIVPHEVIGMANYTKNILIGVGGGDTIHKSHFLGAVHGMERIMGRIDSPVRTVIDEGFQKFLGHLPISFILTVIGREQDDLVMRGIYGGNERSCYVQAAKLSQQVNLTLLEEPIAKAVVYLDPEEFKTTWLGNKAIYRLRMAMADKGELVILAPALHRFGEDMGIDQLIRKYGYRGTAHTLQAVRENEELQKSLSAAAHLIHGTADGRFKITYCPGEGVTRQEIESVGYAYESFDSAMTRYAHAALRDGWNTLSSGERVFYVSNPALGLWSTKAGFEKNN